MKSFVLFRILILYSVKQRVSVSLFAPINIIILLGEPLLGVTPLRKFHQSREKSLNIFQHLGWGILSGEWKIPVLGRGD